MAYIVEINNPFQPLTNTRATEHPGGCTLWQYLEQAYPGFKGFQRPTVIIINNGQQEPEAILQKEWKTRVIQANDIVNIVAIVQAPIVWYIVFAVISLASVVIALSVPKPATPGQQPEPDPVYDLKGQTNQNRLGAPIEDPYGKNRLFPSYAARPYNKYIDNDQYQYQLFCLGHGEYEIHATQIEDTDISNFADVEVEYYGPGESVTLFPDNVVTSVEVAGIELKGTNEVGYAMSGPFTANGSGTEADHLEVDVSLPAGLYIGNDKGGLDALTVTALFEYRLIDNAGAPLGSWTTLANFSKALRTNTPQRFTLEADVAPGRYEVRGQRTNAKNTDAKAQNLLRWDGLRAFLESTKDYGDVTVVALKAKATNNLNDRSSNRFNCIATRKLPIWNGTVWSAPTSTRSISWAFANVIKAQYGGQLGDIFIDLVKLLALDSVFTTKQLSFDFVFEQRLTVWEALRTVANTGRAIPIPEGSQITMIRDDPQTVVKAAFNPWNIVKDSFEYDILPAAEDEYDGLEVTYMDGETWTEETILCLVDDDVGDRPERVRLYGITNRTNAKRQGLYMRACRRRLRENVSFTTGMEGHIPSYNDLILVNHDAPKWGKGGLVVAIADDNVTLTLNEPVTFGVGTHVISFSKKDGTLTDNIVVTAGAAPNEVVLADAVNPGDFYFDRVHERPRFYFGLENFNGVKCKVVSMTPAENDQVAIKAVVYKDVFDGDEEEADPLPPTNMPPKPGAPQIDCALVTLSRVVGNSRLANLSWPPALGALRYRVEASSNGDDWFLVGETAGLAMPIPVEPSQPMFARVQGISAAGYGPYCEAAENGDDAPEEEPVQDYYQGFLELFAPLTKEYYYRNRGGEAALIGKNEFDTFVTADRPPRYRVVKVSGNGKNQVFSDGACAVPNGTVETKFSGAYVWDKTTGVATNGTVADFYINGVFDSTSTVSISQSSPIDSPICDFDRTYTRLSRTVTGNGDCCPGLSGDSKKGEGTWRMVLSDEDKEQDAIARLIQSLIDAAGPGDDPDGWSGWALCNGDSTLPCCESIYDIRLTGYTWDYLEGEFRVVATGFNASGHSIIAVEIMREDLNTLEVTKAETRVFETYADGGGEVTFDTVLPIAPDTRFYVGDVKFYKLVAPMEPIP